MKISIKVIAICTMLFCGNNFSNAQETTTKAKLSLEIDPVTFVYKGYGIHLRLQPKNSKHFLFGVGAYALDVPKYLVNLNEENKEKGWDIRLNQGYSLFVEYHFKEVNRKWLVGAQVALQQTKIENENIVGREKYTNFLVMGYFGYTIKPFEKNNFYIKPWAGIGYNSKVVGTNILGNATYDNPPISFLATLHLGYTF